MIDLPPINYEQTIQALAECGIPIGKIAISYLDDMQLDVVSIQHLDEPLAPQTLTCVFQATVPVGYDVQFEDDEQNKHFWELVLEEGRERARFEGQEWLRQHALLDNMPRFKSGNDLTVFIRAVESHCGVEPGSALEIVGGDLITMRRDFMERQLGDTLAAEAFTCLTKLLAASDLAQGGVKFGFIGNVAISESDDR